MKNPTRKPKPRPRRLQRDADATREALMEAGTELFAELGIDGAKVDAIASRAQVNKAMISYHFGGKQGLYAAIVVATVGPLRESLQTLRTGEMPAAQRLRRFIEVFAEMARKRPRFPAMMLRELIAGGEHLDEHVQPQMTELLRLVSDIVDQGIREGTFRPVNPLLTHLSLVGSLVFFFATAPGRDRLLAEAGIPRPTSEDYVRHVQELFTGGLAADLSKEGKPS